MVFKKAKENMKAAVNKAKGKIKAKKGKGC